MLKVSPEVKLLRGYELLPKVSHFGTTNIDSLASFETEGISQCHADECWNLYPFIPTTSIPQCDISISFLLVRPIKDVLNISLCVPQNNRNQCDKLQIFKNPNEKHYFYKTQGHRENV
ncbi:hypothetical protein HZS_3109 [Henneguya salminicola]|nr:hypothetical protein HZS_3109 [Henneguya salminicola]